MASFTDLVDQSMALVPLSERMANRVWITNHVKASIEMISSIYEWEWRERTIDKAITSAAHTYSMPSDCDFISSKQGVFLSSGNPTKNRIVVLDEFAWNQKYIDDIGGGSEVATTPVYIVPMVDRDSKGNIQIRFYPKPNADYTARIYYFMKPSDADAVNMIADLVLARVYQAFGHWGVDTSQYIYQYNQLMRDLKPMDVKATTETPLFRQNLRIIAHNKSIADKGSRK